MKDCILVVDMSKKNESNLHCFWSRVVIKLDILVSKANVLTYNWSFSENLENYKKLIL